VWEETPKPEVRAAAMIIALGSLAKEVGLRARKRQSEWEGAVTPATAHIFHVRARFCHGPDCFT
jgi:hypothetical protein